MAGFIISYVEKRVVPLQQDVRDVAAQLHPGRAGPGAFGEGGVGGDVGVGGVLRGRAGGDDPGGARGTRGDPWASRGSRETKNWRFMLKWINRINRIK